MTKEINWFTKQKRSEDEELDWLTVNPINIFRNRNRSKYNNSIESGKLTENRERKKYKKELKLKLENWDITKEKYKELLLKHKKRELEKIETKQESENKNIEEKIIEIKDKIIRIIAIEDNQSFQNNLYNLEEELNNIWIENQFILAKNLNEFKYYISRIISNDDYYKNTFYILDNYFPDEEDSRIIANNWKNAHDYIVKKDRNQKIENFEIDYKNIAVVSSDTDWLDEIYPEYVKIIEWKSSYNISYITTIKNWILKRLTEEK